MAEARKAADHADVVVPAVKGRALMLLSVLQRVCRTEGTSGLGMIPRLIATVNSQRRNRHPHEDPAGAGAIVRRIDWKTVEHPIQPNSINPTHSSPWRYPSGRATGAVLASPVRRYRACSARVVPRSGSV